MDSQTISLSLVSGAIIYIIIELDKRYFASKQEAQSYSSVRIATAIALIVYIAVTYFKCNVSCIKQVMDSNITGGSSIDKQLILTDPF
uniref:Uncharacterized protein n=1 Tax=viral metagenome TaxID=1070528 RepID=A0A6C0M128_9ZZZZ